MKATPVSLLLHPNLAVPQSTAGQGARASICRSGSFADGSNLLCDREEQTVPLSKPFAGWQEAYAVIGAPDCTLQATSAAGFTVMQPLFKHKKQKAFLLNLCFSHRLTLQDIFYVRKAPCS